MKIECADIIHIQLPVIHPFETSFGKVTVKDSILVKLYADGLTGYGEGAALGAPLYVPEYAAETYLALKDFLMPTVLGKNIATPDDMAAAYAHVRGHNFAKTALETAFWDLYAQQRGASVKALLGGTQEIIAVGESLGIKASHEELLEEVALRLSEGYKRIKVKIKPGWDLEVTQKIREKFGAIDLMLDGNSAYTIRDLDLFKKLDEFGLTMIEQPLGYDDIIDHASLQREIKTPVCLDESILSAEDARKAIQIGACQIINIKPGRVGGLVESKKIHDLCAAARIGVWCGGMLETGIGRFFNLSVASLPNYVYPADMSPSSIFFAQDIVDRPFVVHNGTIKVPESLMRDFGPNDAAVRKYKVKSETIKV